MGTGAEEGWWERNEKGSEKGLEKGGKAIAMVENQGHFCLVIKATSPGIQVRHGKILQRR